MLHHLFDTKQKTGDQNDPHETQGKILTRSEEEQGCQQKDQETKGQNAFLSFQGKDSSFDQKAESAGAGENGSGVP